MRTKIISAMLALCGLLGAFGGCSKSEGGKQSPPPKAAGAGGEVVAKVGDMEISLQEFEQQLNQQNALIRSRYSSLDQKKKLLDGLVERAAMVMEAKRLGIDRDPEMQQGFDKILARYLVNQEFNNKRVKELNIPDEQIEAYYKENYDRYHAPEKVLIHHLFFPAEPAKVADRKKAKAAAEAALKELKANPQDRRVFFELLRKTGGDEAVKAVSAAAFKTKEELEQELGKKVAEAALALAQANDLSPVVEDDKGFYVLRQAGKQATLDLPIDKVKSQIRTTLFAKARGEAYQAFVDGIKSKVGVKVFDDVLAKAKVDMSAGPGGPGGPGGPEGMAPLKGPGLNIRPSPGEPPAGMIQPSQAPVAPKPHP